MWRGLLIGDLGPAAVAAAALRPCSDVLTASSVDQGMVHVDPSRLDFVIGGSRSLDRAALLAVWSRYPQCRVIVLRDDPADLQATFARVGSFFPDAVAHLRLGRHGCLALTCIGREFSGDLSLETVGRRLGLSPSRLAHVFAAAVGQAFRRYVIAVRLEAAKRLLRETDQTLEAIAERVGFCDAAHLSRLFREVTATRPGSYRHAIGKSRRGVGQGLRSA